MPEGAAPPPPARPPSLPAAAPGATSKPPTPQPTRVEDSTIELWGDAPRTPDNQGAATLPRPLESTATTSPNDSTRRDREGLRVEETVVSVSNRKEAAHSALGSVIVLPAKVLRQRGYTDLSQLLDDLPGLDVVRPFGDVYVRSYWRGHRSVGGDPYLLLLDGVVVNHLSTNTTQILSAIPLSSVDRIEVVMSPVSAVFGPGGTLGAIHIVTNDGKVRQANLAYGPAASGWVTFGGPQSNFRHLGDMTSLLDGTVAYTSQSFRLRISTRLESSVADTDMGGGFLFTRPAAYANSAAWGAPTLSTYPTLSGAFHSPDRKTAVDGRIYIGKGTELAGQYFALSTGFGTTYPGDRRQAMGEFSGRELNLYGRHTAEITSGFTSTSLLRYRESSLRTNSLTSDTATAVTLTNAEAPGRAVELRQDFDLTTRQGLGLRKDQLGVGFGVRLQHAEVPGTLSGYYVASSATWAPGADPGATGRLGPEAIASATVPNTSTDEFGAYAHAKYAFNPNHALNLAFRGDKQRFRDDIALAFRTGYVGTFVDTVTLKAWYGYSMQEPSWQEQLAAAAPPNRPAGLPTAGVHSVEGDVDLRFTAFALHGDVYYNYIRDPVVAAGPAAQLGALTTVDHRQLLGADAGGRLLLPPFSAFAYYSHVFMNDDWMPATARGANGARALDGDIAADKVWAGVTLDLGIFSGTLLTRWIGDRYVVPTNPTGTVNWYALLDGNLTVNDLFDAGVWCGLRVTNILGTVYEQPGVQTADSGAQGALSAGAFSSRLPQPGRAFFATAGVVFDPEPARRPGR